MGYYSTGSGNVLLELRNEIGLRKQEDVVKRRNWVLIIYVIFAVLCSTIVLADDQIPARLLDAQAKYFKTTPAVGDILFATSSDLIPPGEKDHFIDLIPDRNDGVIHPLHAWSRISPELREFLAENAKIRIPPREVGNAIFTRSYVCLDENETVVDLAEIKAPDGSPLIRAVFLGDRRDVAISVSIHYFRPATATSPASSFDLPKGIPETLNRGHIWFDRSSEHAIVRKAACQSKEAICAIGIEQGGREQVFEVSLKGDHYVLNGEDVDTSRGASLRLAPAKKKMTELSIPETFIKIKSETWPKLFLSKDSKYALLFGYRNRLVFLIDLQAGKIVSETDNKQLISQILGSDGIYQIESQSNHILDFKNDQLPKVNTLLSEKGANILKEAWMEFDPVAAIDRDRSKWLIAGYRSPIQCYDNKGELLWTNPVELHKAVTFGDRIVVSQRSIQDSSLLILNANTGEKIREISLAMSATEGNISVSPDDSMVFVSGGNPKVLDSITGKLIAAPALGSADRVGFSNDGRWAAMCRDRFCLIDLSVKNNPIYYKLPEKLIDDSKRISSAVFSDDSSMLFLVIHGSHSNDFLYALDLKNLKAD